MKHNSQSWLNRLLKSGVILTSLLTISTSAHAQFYDGVQYKWGTSLNPTTGLDFGIDINPTKEGTFIAGATKRSSTANNDIYINHLNDDGAILWTASWGGGLHEYVGEIKQINDGNFLLVGTTNISSGQSDLVVLKYSYNGTLLWSNTYGGSGQQSGYTFTELSSGGFVIGGNGIYRIDASGNLIWSKPAISSQSMDQIADGNLISVNGSLLQKIDLNGTVIWSTSIAAQYTNASNTHHQEVQQTPDGGFILAGWNYETSFGTYQAHLVKTNATGGVTWNYVYTSLQVTPLCNVHETFGYDVAQTKDGGYLLAGLGYTGNPNWSGTGNFYCKTNSNGISDNFADPTTWMLLEDAGVDGYGQLHGICKAGTCGDGFAVIGTLEPPSSNDHRITIGRFYDKDINGGQPFDYGDITISTNTTWSADKFVAGTITVKPGATLTIDNNSKLHMGLCGNIIVEPNGQLRVLSATVTSLTTPEAMWQGINVHGDRTLRHQPQYQGKVYASNALIENARNAISTKKDLASGWDFNSTGGIVQCSQTTFRNNRRDVEFLSYHHIHPFNASLELSNTSYFNRTTFETTNNLKDPSVNLAAHVTMWDVNGIRFRGCTFSNTNPNVTVPTGTGLYTINAGYSINEFCTGISTYPPPPSCNGQRTQFNGLYQGIQSQGLNRPEYSIQVRNTDFNASYGMYMQGISNGVYTLNNFNSQHIGGIFYGAYLDQCPTWKLEGNVFTSDYTVSSPGATVGLYINESGAVENSIYRNTFDAHFVGVVAIGENKGSSITSGMKISCNDFTTNNFDIYVTGSGAINFPGISSAQGWFDEPAGNLFTQSSSTNLYTDFYNNADGLLYFHHDPLLQPRVEPLDITGVTNVNTSDPYATSDCPNKLIIKTHAQYKLKAAQFKNDLDGLNQAYEALIDGGDSPGLINNMHATNSPQQVKNLLLAQSPYLSDKLLIELINTPNFPPSKLRDVLIANPHCGKRKIILDALDAQGFPAPFRAQVIAASEDHYTDREKLEAEISKATELLREAQKDDDRLYGFDLDENGDPIMDDEHRAFLEDIKKAEEQYRFIEKLINRKEFTEARIVLDDIPTTCTLDERELLEYTDNRTWYLFHMEMAESGRNIFDLSSQEIAMVQSLEANSFGRAQTNARNLLLMAAPALVNYSEPTLLPLENRMGAVIQVIEATNPDRYSVYPNPAVEHVTVAAQIHSFAAENGQFIVTDLMGRTVAQQQMSIVDGQVNQTIDLTKLDAGQYFITFFVNGENKHVEKINVIR